MTNAKVAQKFYCVHCDYTCSRKFNFDKHIMTAKHKSKLTTNEDVVKVANKSFECVCGEVLGIYTFATLHYYTKIIIPIYIFFKTEFYTLYTLHPTPFSLFTY
jgi:hypothetical protein